MADENQQATSVGAWKGRSAGTPIDLPSENTALVKRVKPEMFMQSGMIPDPLSGIISKAINEKKGLPPSKMDEIGEDPKMLAATMLMMDRVLVFCVVQPKVLMPPPCGVEVNGEKCNKYFTGEGGDVHTNAANPHYHAYKEGERDDDVLYTDEVDIQDKIFIFNWALGGTSDLKSFRTELQGTVDAVSEQQGLRVSAESTSGSE